MTEPWEIDPTDPDGEGAGAEGGAVGGDSAGDTTLQPPLQPQQDVDRTNPFEPGASSTPYPPDDTGEAIELGNMDFDKKLNRLTEEYKQKKIDNTLRMFKDKFPKVDFYKLGPIGWGKREENIGEIVQFGKKLGETRVLKKDGGLLKSFTNRFKTALGESAEDIIKKKNSRRKRNTTKDTERRRRKTTERRRKDCLTQTKSRRECAKSQDST